MNYSTDIKFNKNLIRKEKTTITYSGSLFRTGSEAVTIVYGFGDNWEHTTEKEMTKNENNFSVEIELLDFDKINFCFRNSNNIWDNNNYLNYIAPISEPEPEYNFIINENLVDGMLNNLFEADLSKYENNTVSQIEVEPIEVKNQEENSSVELIENSVVAEESFIIEIPEDSPIDIQEFIGDIQEEPSLTNDLEVEFSSLFDESQDTKKEEIVNFDMDSLIDEILSPIIEAKSSETSDYQVNVKIEELDVDKSFLEYSNEEHSVEENVEQASVKEEESILENINSETSLIEVKEFENSFIVSPRSLNKLYILKKRIKLAIYKFFTAIPKIIESSFNEEKN